MIVVAWVKIRKVNWLLSTQAQSELAHLQTVQQAMQRHSMSVISDYTPASGQQYQRLGQEMLHELDMHEETVQDLEKNIEVCVAEACASHVVLRVMGTSGPSADNHTSNLSPPLYPPANPWASQKTPDGMHSWCVVTVILYKGSQDFNSS